MTTAATYKADWYTIYDYGSGDVVVVVKKGKKKFMLPAWISLYAYSDSDSDSLNAYKFRWNNLTQSSPGIEGLVFPMIDDTYIMHAHGIPEYARHIIYHADFTNLLRANLCVGKVNTTSYLNEAVRFPLKKKSLERVCVFYRKIARQ